MLKVFINIQTAQHELSKSGRINIHGKKLCFMAFSGLTVEHHSK
jgi:hypothetical protein